MKKTIIAAIFLSYAFVLGGCGTVDPTAEAQDEVQEETVQEEEPEAETEVEAEPEEEPETVEAEEEKEAPPVYEEDKNVYGNSIGNLNNEGTFIYNEEDGCLYFQDIYTSYMVKTVPETGHTINISDRLFTMINLYDGKLYGVETTSEHKNGKTYIYDLQKDNLEVLREDPVSYLQVVDGTLYFTDDGDHTLRKMDTESREETILVDEPVYFPVVYKDIIVFQLDSEKERLYSIPKDGGEMVKLNDVRSYEPMVYQDRIYYKALDENEEYTVRGMNMDGSDEEIILPMGTLQMNLYNGILYYVLQDTPNKVFYIDLADEAREAHDLELGDLIRSALKNTYGTTDIQIVMYGPIQFSGSYMIFMDMMKIGEQSYKDEYIYKMDTDKIFIIPEYCKEKEDTTAKQDAGSNAPAASDSGQTAANAGQPANSEPAAAAPTAAAPESDKDAQARAVAQSIADSIPAGSDLERVRAAAAAVAGYCSRGTYTSEVSDYNTAYGVFCKGVNTCAGATRALGLVLECMGYSWTHKNPNQWTHQWCELTMDGQTGWADGMGGLADYGEYPFMDGGSYTTPDGTTYYLAQ